MANDERNLSEAGVKKLEMRIAELENRLEEFTEPPELSADEIKAYKKVAAAIVACGRSCGRACGRSCYPCYYEPLAAAVCEAEMSLVACGRACGRSCYPCYYEALAACECGVDPTEGLARACGRACGRACSCGACIAGPGGPGPRLGRTGVGRFANLGE
jgi:hypothetical protein